MDDTRKYLGVVDYVIFGSILLISTIIGLYFGCKKQKEATSAEYLLANRSVSWFPIFVSLVVSFFSPVGVMGITSQIYSTGIAFLLQFVGYFVPICLNAIVFAPLFRKLQLVSANEYLERRFSKPIRLLGCSFFILQYLLYLSMVLYTPSLALETVANVPILVTILATGVICTFYTTLGGMKAVIWTDVFQAAIMLVGLLATAVIGIINVGSFEKVFDIAKKYNRFVFDIDADPRVYHSVWGTILGATFSYMNAWTITQPTVQRVVATKSLKDARKALFYSYGGIIFIYIILAFDSLVIFAAFIGCDPYMSGKIKAPDQILPYFVVTKLNHLQGVSGLFVASLFCFSLSTLSSALNSLSAIVLEDVVKAIRPNISKEKQYILLKVIVCVCGAFVTGFAFVVPSLGKFVIKLSIQLFGVIGGPYFGIFAMGVFTKRSNSLGVAAGSICGFCVGMMFSVGQMIYPPNNHLPPLSMATCVNSTVYSSNSTFVYPKGPPNHNSAFADLVSVSYLWHGMISISVTCLVCLIVSLCSAKYFEPSVIDKDLVFDISKAIKSFSGEEDDETYRGDKVLEKNLPISFAGDAVNKDTRL